MEETWELVNINKVKTGVLHKRKDREDSIPSGMYHIVVDIWTKRKDGKILLTQRHPDKSPPGKNYGLKWECSGGSVIAGETVEEGACRELFEETGLKTTPDKLLYLGETVKKKRIIETFLYCLENDSYELKLQEEEVIDSAWLSVEEIEFKRSDIVNSIWDRFLQFKQEIQKHYAEA